MRADPQRMETYLRHHLMGASLAELTIEYWARRAPYVREREFLNALLREIEADHETLEKVLEAVSGKRQHSWLGPIARVFTRGRWKLTRSRRQPLSLFEALEMLSIGIAGKRALWRIMGVLNDPRLSGFNWGGLEQRAVDQFALVDDERIRVGCVAFTARTGSAGATRLAG